MPFYSMPFCWMSFDISLVQCPFNASSMPSAYPPVNTFRLVPIGSSLEPLDAQRKASALLGSSQLLFRLYSAPRLVRMVRACGAINAVFIVLFFNWAKIYLIQIDLNSYQLIPRASPHCSAESPSECVCVTKHLKMKQLLCTRHTSRTERLLT